MCRFLVQSIRPFASGCRAGKFFFLLLFLCRSVYSQENKDTLRFFSPAPDFNTDRLRGVVFTEISGYAGSMLGVNEFWYRDYPRENFHFFNDNSEWLQVDKGSHVASAYYVGKLGMDVMKWTGVPWKESSWYGGTLGLAFLTTVEIFDGYSTGWGASWGDIAANIGGTAFLIGQEYLWQEQKMLLKYSFTPTRYAQYRPSLLGSDFHEQMLKDYNGMTFWLSANMASFLKTGSRFPQWLNMAVGYGADGMTGGHQNPAYDSNGNPYPYFERKRQFYLSFDIDATRIKTRSAFLGCLLNTFGFIKFPSPSIEFSGKRIKFHPLFF